MLDTRDPLTLAWLRGLLTGAAISSGGTLALVAAYGTWWAGLPVSIGCLGGAAFLALAVGPRGLQ